MLGTLNIKTILRIAPWIFTALLTISTLLLFKSNKTLNSELVIERNNVESYQGIVAKNINENKVLTLDITDLKSQNDSMINTIDSLLIKDKVKKSNVKTITSIKQELKVITDTIVMIKDSSFSTKVVPNKFTEISIALKKDSLSVVLDIKNDQYLYIYNKREYKNKNKNFLKRLFTLDFKKVTVTKYKLVNSNDLIKNSDVRVIEAKQ